MTLELLFGGVSVVSIGLACLPLLTGPPTLRSILLVSFIHTISLVFALWVVITQGFVSVPASRAVLRGLLSCVLVAVSYPAAALMFFSVFFGLTPTQFLDFDDHSTETFSRLDWLRNDIAIPLGLFLAAITVLLLVAAAVRIFIGRWPKRVWTASILIPIFIVSAAKLCARFAVSYLLLVLLGSLVFGVVIGYWIKSAQKALLVSHTSDAGARAGESITGVELRQ